MKVNIYYGGRGLIEDPTIYVINKLKEVLEELRVEVVRYNLYEDKQGINILPKTLKDVDGVILAATVEWMGIGGLMQQFLDACWLYADKEKISQTYMLPVVMSSAYGEREAEYTLIKAWEMLGGIPCDGLCAYVDDHVEFETNPVYGMIIEKKAETLYRSISHKAKVFPTSTHAVKQSVLRTNAIQLTPQESEQLSMYVSNDTYVKKQKEDIEELAQLFKGMLGEKEGINKEEEWTKAFQKAFTPIPEFRVSYAINVFDLKESFVIEVDENKLKCYFGNKEDADVIAKTKKEVLEGIMSGEVTLQKAFMSGDLTAKGNFKTLRMFDKVFNFI